MDSANDQLILALGRVEGKLDSFAQSQIRHESRLDSHDKRIGILERWQSRIIGMAAAAGGGVAAALKYLGVT